MRVSAGTYVDTTPAPASGPASPNEAAPQGSERPTKSTRSSGSSPRASAAPTRGAATLRPRKPPPKPASGNGPAADDSNDTPPPTADTPDAARASTGLLGAASDLRSDSSADSSEQDHGQAGQDRGGRRRHKGFAFSEVHRAMDEAAGAAARGSAGRRGAFTATAHGGPARAPASLADAARLTQALVQSVRGASAQALQAGGASQTMLGLVCDHLRRHASPSSKATLATVKQLLVQQAPTVMAGPSAPVPSAGEASRNALLPVMLLHALRPRLASLADSAAGRLDILQRMGHLGDEKVTVATPPATHKRPA
ncbi:hypothetical protein AACH06_00770 [Ideonella sp. DXS29W]|uniref:Uncharacterized protein n=1 Tax=Ideonella lacteola TaxID=2984193 RepID=A0ABU9BHB8_9BURK